MENKQVFSLKDILDMNNNRKIELPSVQRGFVWHPRQIERLWDSLLRGYPTGSIVLHKDNCGTYQLLDGQQRCTSICLGLTNLDDTAPEKILNASLNDIRIFIDLEKPDFSEDDRMYIFRVITKSHPWGYQKTDNTKTLPIEKIRKALDFYGVEDYLHTNIDKFSPYDAVCPLPINIFVEYAINKKSVEELTATLKPWLEKAKELQRSVEEDEDEESDALDADVQEVNPSKYTIAEIYNAVKKMIESTRIPALYLDFDWMKSSENVSASKGEAITQDGEEKANKEDNEDAPENNNYESNDDIENLFIRLNAEGTRLSGEELTYSILKSSIDDQSIIDKIKEQCEGLMKPARFITLVFNLYKATADKKNFSLQLSIRPRMFQRTMKDESEKFKKFILAVLDENKYENQTLLTYTKNVLQYNKEMDGFKNGKEDYRFPYLISSKIADSAPGVMLMLLYRIYSCKDRFEYNTNTHRKMLGIVFLFMWFVDDKFIKTIWHTAIQSKLSIDEFWSHFLISAAQENEYFELPKDAQFLKDIDALAIKANTNIWDKIDERYHPMFEFLLDNEDIVLYAQRCFLNQWFTEQEFQLDDTNVPFDWDHISANEFANKKNLPKPLRTKKGIGIYGTNGNFRAWPYSLNRGDGKKTPAKKLIATDENFADWKKQLKNRKPDLSTIEEIQDFLLDASFCKEEWLEDDENDLKKGEWKRVYSLILSRIRALYSKIDENFNLSALSTQNKPVPISAIFKGDVTNKMPNGEKWPYLEENQEIKFIKMNPTVSFYSWYDKDDVWVQFGLVELENNNYFKSLKKARIREIEEDNGWHHIYKESQIACHHTFAYKYLVSEIKTWLHNLQNEDKLGIEKKFLSHIADECLPE
jgi:hypothetical protein